MLNVIAIERDKKHNDKLVQYFKELGVNGLTFSDFESLYCWLDSNDAKGFPSFRYLFISIKDSDDAAFSESLSLAEKFSDNPPIIVFMLNKHCNQSYIRSLKYGSGYLLKPFTSDLLVSTIHYHAKHDEINRLLGNRNKKLLEYKETMDREHAIVESLFSTHFENHLIESDYIHFYISPASVFNGDVVLMAKGPKNSLYVAVGDVTGHGLPAAIGAMPVYSTFRAMAKKGLSAGIIAYEMNKSLRTLLPDNMMMALTIMKIDYADATATIWSGGMPEVIIVDDQGEVVRKIGSKHSPLAMLDPDEFRQDIDVVNLKNNDRLFFYTDGIEEARNAKGEMFGTERFQALFSGDPTFIFNKVIITKNAFIGSSEQDDDITLVEVKYKDNLNQVVPPEPKKEEMQTVMDWEMDFVITPVEIKQSDSLAQIINFLNNAVSVSNHQDYISTILSELFNNALDHGLLELDSDIKKTEDGFVEYYIERSKRIDGLSAGTINIHMRYENKPDLKQGSLTIMVKDTGKGFDYSQAISAVEPEARGYGHGLQLVDSLCESVTFSEEGCAVTAVYLIPFK